MSSSSLVQWALCLWTPTDAGQVECAQTENDRPCLRGKSEGGMERGRGGRTEASTEMRSSLTAPHWTGCQKTTTALLCLFHSHFHSHTSEMAFFRAPQVASTRRRGAVVSYFCCFLCVANAHWSANIGLEGALKVFCRCCLKSEPLKTTTLHAWTNYLRQSNCSWTTPPSILFEARTYLHCLTLRLCFSSHIRFALVSSQRGHRRACFRSQVYWGTCAVDKRVHKACVCETMYGDWVWNPCIKGSYTSCAAGQSERLWNDQTAYILEQATCRLRNNQLPSVTFSMCIAEYK